MLIRDFKDLESPSIKIYRCYILGINHSSDEGKFNLKPSFSDLHLSIKHVKADHKA